jgi:hypothetical protein
MLIKIKEKSDKYNKYEELPFFSWSLILLYKIIFENPIKYTGDK